MNTYYVITDDNIVEKMTFDYDSNLDVKKDKINPFASVDLNVDLNVDLTADCKNGSKIINLKENS